MIRRTFLLALTVAFLVASSAPAEEKKQSEPKKKAAPAKAEPKSKAADTKEAAPKSTAAAAPAAPSNFEPVGPNFVGNASFEDWKAGAPLVWNLAEGAGDKWSPVTAKQHADAQDGKVSISLPAPKAKQTVVIAQTLGQGRNKFKHDTRFMLAAAVKTKGENTVHVVLSYKRGEKEHKIRRIPRGTGEWEQLRQEFWIPKDADLSSFRLSITRLSGAEGDVLVDDVKVQQMAPAKPAPASPAPVGQGPKVPHGTKAK